VENGLTQHLGLGSTLQKLSLYDFQVETSHMGMEGAQTFQDNPLFEHLLATALRRDFHAIADYVRCGFFQKI
jgi:hypothetical protein